jgi:hypothetical protein
MKRTALALVAAFALLSLGAKADTLRTFSIEDTSGIFGGDGTHNQNSILSGLVTIDTTTGQGLYGYIQYQFYGDFNQYHPPVTMQILSDITTAGPLFDGLDFPNEHQLTLSTANADGSELFAHLGVPVSLINYMGGDLCYVQGLCEGDMYTYFGYYNFHFPPFTVNGNQYPGSVMTGNDTFFHAKLSLVSEVVTPEPATWILIGTGALSLLGAAKRRLLPF